MKVFKFGGTSVGSAPAIKSVYHIVKQTLDTDDKLVIVCSALGGVTNQLINIGQSAANGKANYKEQLSLFLQRHIDLIDELFGEKPEELISALKIQYNNLENILYGVFLVRECSPRTMDFIYSFGERFSCQIITKFFSSNNIVANYLDARKVIKTNKTFGFAKVNQTLTSTKILSYIDSVTSGVIVTTGFIASDIGGLTTTLGRGGSDYSGAIIASAVDAENYCIYTDVSGVLSANPNIVKNAFTIEEMKYEEARELSHFGAKVIYPPTIEPVRQKKIPVFIKNTFAADDYGTKIHDDAKPTNNYLKGLSSISGICMISIDNSAHIISVGINAKVIDKLESNQIPVLLITQCSSAQDISIAIYEKDEKLALELIKTEIQNHFGESNNIKVNIDNDLSILAAVGENMIEKPGISGKLFSALGNNGVNIEAIAQGSSERNITTVIKSKDIKKALNITHDTFFQNTTKTINLFIAGVGLIGSTLIDQIRNQIKSLVEDQGIKINIVGLANSKTFNINPNGLNLIDWKSELVNNQPQPIEKFVDEIIKLNLSNSIFIDATSSIDVVEQYPRILSHSIAISAANKLAASSSFDTFLELKSIAKRNDTLYLYETNVGAGLPLLSTIKNLLVSGDEIISIEGILSGTLSYIFNVFDGSLPFYEIVKKAQELGLTEPDPRIDLSGDDVSKKITILAREAGFRLDKKDVTLESFIPNSCMESKSVDEFYDLLEKEQDYFDTLIGEANKNNKRLRYLASFDGTKAKVGIQAVDDQSPFYNLGIGDNIISVYTKRYNKTPLVIQGAGAGAEVTAAGVFAEIIQIANENFSF